MRIACLAVLVLLACSSAAQAHEVLHTVERGKAVAVKVYFADGEVAAYREVQVFSPADARIPYQKGRTDRSGYVAFMPDTPGAWRVVLVDDTGHGLDVKVDVAAPGAAPADGKSAPASVSSWAFALRPIIGATAIALIFAALFFGLRRKAPRK
jgi:nickel transport protein